MIQITDSALGKLMAHVEIMRPYTLAYAGLLALAGASIGARHQMPTRRALQCALVTMCGWLAGHYVGDYFDRDIDARSKPGRPVPSGRVTPREALVSMVAIIACGNVAALKLGRSKFSLAVATTILGIAYSKVFKSRALLGNLDRGLLGACAVVFGGSLSPRVLLLGGAVLFHDGATNLVGALRDVSGDRLAGCRTVPVVYGLSRGVQVACGLASLGWSLSLLTLVLARAGRAAAALFGAATLLDLLVYPRLISERAHLSSSRALSAHKVLVAERLLLSASFAAVRAPRLTLSLVGIALPISLLLQSKMRDRHEQQSPGLDS